MVYKFLFTQVNFDEENISIKKFFIKSFIKYNDIKHMIIEKPKYHAIPGTGYSYYYDFYIVTHKRLRNKRFSLVFNYDESEYIDLISYLSRKNINVIEKEYDNRFNFDA